MFRAQNRRSVIFGVLAIVAPMLLAACGSANNLNNPSVGTYTSIAPANKGGTIRFSGLEFPDSVNPLFVTSAIDRSLTSAIWSGPLVDTVSAGALRWVPDELTEVPTPQNGDVSKDGRTVTMHLRHDLHWSDGTPLTSADYLYGYKTLMDPATAAVTTSGYDHIKSITAPDPYTIKLTYTRPFGPYLFYLPFPLPEHAWASIADRNLRHTLDVNIAPKVTNGPYMIQRFTNGQGYTLIPNPYYHSTTFHGPFLKSLVFKRYSSKDALITAVKAGETDISTGYAISDLAALRNLNLPGIAVDVTRTLVYEHLDFNMSSAIFQGDTGLHIRRAIAEAIDRCRIISEGLKQDSCIHFWVNSTEPQPAIDAIYANPFTFDLSAARTDMEAAGYTQQPDGTWLDARGQPFPTLRFVTTSGDTTRANNARIIQSSLAALGIPITINFYNADQLFGSYTSGGILATGRYDLAEFASADLPDPDGEYSRFHSSQIPSVHNPNGQNYGRVDMPEVDRDLELGRYTIDIQRRLHDYEELQNILVNQQVVTIPLYTYPTIETVDNAVQNYTPNPLDIGNSPGYTLSLPGAGDEWNVADWWRTNE